MVLNHGSRLLITLCFSAREKEKNESFLSTIKLCKTVSRLTEFSCSCLLEVSMKRDSNSADHSRRSRSLASAEVSSFPAAEARRVPRRPNSNATPAPPFCSSRTRSNSRRRCSSRSARNVPWGLCSSWSLSVSAAAFQCTSSHNATLSRVHHSPNPSTKSTSRWRSQLPFSICFALKCCFDYDKRSLRLSEVLHRHTSTKSSPTNSTASW